MIMFRPISHKEERTIGGATWSVVLTLVERLGGSVDWRNSGQRVYR